MRPLRTDARVSWEKALEVIPGGTQTLSKSPDRYVEGVYPYFIESGKGAVVWDTQGNRYTDYPLALGAITLGHADPHVIMAVCHEVTKGTLFTLPTLLEQTVARDVLQLAPWADQVRFTKTGSEACSAAVKLARAVTGREHVIVCGYHGWHDWYTISTDKTMGIPASCATLVHRARYNDLQTFADILNQLPGQVAAVIMEPCIYDPPTDGFLPGVQALAHEHGALLIFDEMVTGGRFPGGSAGTYFGVEPDLATFGKGIANGFPLAAVVGRSSHMALFGADTSCFFSTTFGGETSALAACHETLRLLLSDDVIGRIMWDCGLLLMTGYNAIAKELGIETSCVGYPGRTMFLFPSAAHKSLFWQECVKREVLFGYAQFISLAHTPRIIENTLDVVRASLQTVKEHWAAPERVLEGPVAKEVFRLVATKEAPRGPTRTPGS